MLNASGVLCVLIKSDILLQIIQGLRLIEESALCFLSVEKLTSICKGCYLVFIHSSVLELVYLFVVGEGEITQV